MVSQQHLNKRSRARFRRKKNCANLWFFNDPVFCRRAVRSRFAEIPYASVLGCYPNLRNTCLPDARQTHSLHALIVCQRSSPRKRYREGSTHSERNSRRNMVLTPLSRDAGVSVQFDSPLGYSPTFPWSGSLDPTYGAPAA